MDKTMPVPDLNTLGGLALAAARNARRLLDDAELLFTRSRSASAYSLAVLAFEEAGKAWLCVVAMMVPGDVRPEWPYADLISKHVDKLMAAHVIAHMFASVNRGQDMIVSLAGIGENLEGLAREHNQAKQRGLYADLLEDMIWEPASITKGKARRMLVTVRGLVDHGGSLADPAFIAWLADETQEVLWVKNMVWGRFIAGLQQGGPEGMLESLRSLLDETGAAEGLPQMLREESRHAAISIDMGPRRVQPRKQSRSQRRRR